MSNATHVRRVPSGIGVNLSEAQCLRGAEFVFSCEVVSPSATKLLLRPSSLSLAQASPLVRRRIGGMALALTLAVVSHAQERKCRCDKESPTYPVLM